MAFLGKSWDLAKACFHVLRKDKELLLFPLIAGAVAVSTFLVLAVSFFLFPATFVWLLVLTILLGPGFFAFLGVLMEAAVVGCATIRLQGGDPKVRDGLKIAFKNWWPLLQWAIVGVIIGAILGSIRGLFNRPTTPGRGPSRSFGFPPIRFSPSGMGTYGAGFGIGDIIAGGLGMAWAVATFFVIPVVLFEKLSPFKGVKRSVGIIKTLWKETLLLKFGFSVMFSLLGLLGFVAIVLGVLTGVTFVPIGESTYEAVITNAPALIAGITIAIVYWAALACTNFAMKGILRATLYEYSRIEKGKSSARSSQAEEYGPLTSIISTFQKETPAEAPQPTQSAASEIEKLATLRDKGIITEEEFQEKKRKLLEKI